MRVVGKKEPVTTYDLLGEVETEEDLNSSKIISRSLDLYKPKWDEAQRVLINP